MQSSTYRLLNRAYGQAKSTIRKITKDVDCRFSDHKKYWIVIHTAAADIKGITAKTIDKWHKQNGWTMIGYNYVICDDGRVEKGRSESMVGAHCRGLNHTSVGICVTGHGDCYDFNQSQYESLRFLVNDLMEKYGISKSHVIGHRECSIAGAPKTWKTCPGKKVDMDKVREYICCEKT